MLEITLSQQELCHEPVITGNTTTVALKETVKQLYHSREEREKVQTVWLPL
jgi:hypothetical protein